MSIKVNSISKWFKTNKALHKISFEAKPGDIVGVLGPNGAGKSTMIDFCSAPAFAIRAESRTLQSTCSTIAV